MVSRLSQLGNALPLPLRLLYGGITGRLFWLGIDDTVCVGGMAAFLEGAGPAQTRSFRRRYLSFIADLRSRPYADRFFAVSEADSRADTFRDRRQLGVRVNCGLPFIGRKGWNRRSLLMPRHML